jgi:hypothetical protein
MSTLAPTAHSSTAAISKPAAAPRLDLYAPIHKALRLFMGDTLARVGRIDLSDSADSSATLQQLDALLELCRGHVAHENQHLGVTTGTVSMVLATAISSSAVKVVVGDDCLVQQDVGEDDHDQRLGLQQPADEARPRPAQPRSARPGARRQQLAGHRRGQQPGRGHEHRGAAHVPLRAQPRC